MPKIFTKIYTNKDKTRKKVKIVTTKTDGIYYGGYKVFAGAFVAGQAAAILSDGFAQVPVLMPD